MNEWVILGQVILASILTMLVGLEREAANKAAGIRTNMIVGGFSCLVIILMHPLINFIQVDFSGNSVNVDPIRVLQALVVGISFLGAGTIVKARNQEQVTGITTAATLLYSMGIGICIGLDFYVLAIALTVFILVINRVINYLVKTFTSVKENKKE